MRRRPKVERYQTSIDSCRPARVAAILVRVWANARSPSWLTTGSRKVICTGPSNPANQARIPSTVPYGVSGPCALGGLSTGEIARALLVPEATVGQRISRAKARIRDTGAQFRTPTADERDERLPA